MASAVAMFETRPFPRLRGVALGLCASPYGYANSLSGEASRSRAADARHSGLFELFGVLALLRGRRPGRRSRDRPLRQAPCGGPSRTSSTPSSLGKQTLRLDVDSSRLASLLRRLHTFRYGPSKSPRQAGDERRRGKTWSVYFRTTPNGTWSPGSGLWLSRCRFRTKKWRAPPFATRWRRAPPRRLRARMGRGARPPGGTSRSG